MVALTRPSAVPTHSCTIGTSFWTTGTTSTSGARGDAGCSLWHEEAKNAQEQASRARAPRRIARYLDRTSAVPGCTINPLLRGSSAVRLPEVAGLYAVQD